ncbi:Maf family nucleotide pyrophosphatase [Cochleicola gelatinilyticus]|uniref:dTTP/UTP pyrophosphatase n=1 Tax=Cochleicola gelatinilyticus TaxID=1763537 RepID=A0A167HSV5_9FLAO|nr:Maf family nucleotide pyrophosphatase [Cochleicola gelatinilyticus]OAB78929.1 septum formation inhibitor Maf [Cochleicola gelatinilyticus]
MLKEKLQHLKIILASGSPRRQNFFHDLDIDFTIDVREIEEVFPAKVLKGPAITDYLAKLKASAFQDLLDNDVLITSDTIVWKDGKAIGKPVDKEDAKKMLQHLSGDLHEVITSVCFTSKTSQYLINDTTKVWFNPLTEAEIDYYLTAYQPFDKAGSYGIQEWIGYIGINRIEGSYFNVMGLPTHLVYKTLLDIADGKIL